MRIGHLRNLVRIETPTNTSDGAGGEVTTWATVATVWADVRPLSGFKTEEGDVVVIGQQRFKIAIRYRADVGVTNRVVSLRPDARPDATFRIDSVADPDGRRRTLHIMATEGVPT